MRVSILGSNLIARHFVKYLIENKSGIQITLWTFGIDEYREFDKVPTSSRFYGFKNLPNALLGADIVLNLHECSDFSLLPDIEKLQKHNVEIVRSILFHINCPLIHLSSPYLQCSNRWPNVYEPERDPFLYNTQWPYQEYCSSKYEAELLIKQSSNDCYIVRCVPTYGDGDESSILTDLIYFSNDNVVYSIGDNDGHMQMAYAGNVSMALWTAVCRLLGQSTNIDLNGFYDGDFVNFPSPGLKSPKENMFTIKEEGELEVYQVPRNTLRTSDCDNEATKEFHQSGDDINEYDVFDEDSTFLALGASSSSIDWRLSSHFKFTEKERIFEIFLINDETPKRTIYNTYSQLLFNGKRHRSKAQWPFLPFYYIYLIFSLFVKLLVRLFGPLNFAKLMPHPSFLYFYFHHWTFFNSTKSTLLLGYKPHYNYKMCVENSVKHYRAFRKKDVKKFSWQNSISA